MNGQCFGRLREILLTFVEMVLLGVVIIVVECRGLCAIDAVQTNWSMVS